MHLYEQRKIELSFPRKLKLTCI